MKKIIVSLSIIAAVAAIAVGATTAFFSDTETSTGNTFTAGALDLKVDSFGSMRNGVGVSDSSWFAKDLTSQKFFNFGDVKPGDWFGRSISVHVVNNPAWACLYVENPQNDENEVTDPELKAGDTHEDGPGHGELGGMMHVLAWQDFNPDGQHTPDEPFLVDSFFDVFTEITLADSTTGKPLNPTQTEMLHMDICAGKHVVNPETGAVSCDGSQIGNQGQTDKASADVRLYVEQSRNNPNFKCSEAHPPIAT